MHKKLIMFALFTLSFMQMAGGMLVPLWVSFTKHIGGDLRTVGIALAIYSLGRAVFAVSFGYLEGKFFKVTDWHRFSYVLAICISVGYFFIAAPWQLYLVQFGLSIASGMRSPALSLLYQSMLTRDSTLLGWSLFNSLTSLALGVAAIAGSHLAHFFGYHLVFSILIGFEVLALIMAFFVRLPTKMEQHAH